MTFAKRVAGGFSWVSPVAFVEHMEWPKDKSTYSTRLDFAGQAHEEDEEDVSDLDGT
ncbi:hypothetical protein TanjilG_19304 [Lupinus angustifolius]|uniref:Uncharacterized protein n=1 Tax=Lupinus angustifolius TaxID=3871 RepID=A0A1J7IUD4_LUPAN|nr:hypothetical protein TanjilG_19304 [Lupinus angustifolius]